MTQLKFRTNRHNPALFLLLSLYGLTLLSGTILASSVTSADVVDDVTINVPVACNMTGELDTPHTATINPGQNQTDIGTTNFTVFCNDSSGYAIYAIGYSNEEYGNNKLLATINNQLTPSYDIITGTATSGATSNWSMKLTPVSGTYAPTIENGFGSYSNVPTEYTKVATFASNTDFTIGSSLQSTYQAYITSTQPAGTYAGKVKYTMVHPASEVPLQPVDTPAGYISYNPNASGVTDTMGDQQLHKAKDWSSCIDTDFETYCYDEDDNAIDINTLPELDYYTANLWASNFQRLGYGFAGWSETFDYSDSSKYYGPNETINVSAEKYNEGLSLYAIWIPSAGNLQGWTGCSSLASGAVTALTDQRDNNTYAVAKLADNKCWMIENLRLNNNTTGNSDGSLAQGYNSSFIGLANPETANFGNFTTANSLYSIDGSTPAPAITGYNQAARFPRYNNQNTASPVANMTSNNANVYSYGNYYTWSAAIADTSYYDANNQTISGTSICPSGWHLPSGGDKNNFASSEFWALSRAAIGTDPANYGSSNQPSYYGTPEGANASNTLRSYPNNFIYSDIFFGNSPYARGLGGYYWSSTVFNSFYSYYFSIGISSANPGTYYNYKNYGLSIRCMSGS